MCRLPGTNRKGFQVPTARLAGLTVALLQGPAGSPTYDAQHDMLEQMDERALSANLIGRPTAADLVIRARQGYLYWRQLQARVKLSSLQGAAQLNVSMGTIQRFIAGT